MIIGTESAELPNEERSGHNLASLLGKDANPRIPNGHHNIAGPGIGKICGTLTPRPAAIRF